MPTSALGRTLVVKPSTGRTARAIDRTDLRHVRHLQKQLSRQADSAQQRRDVSSLLALSQSRKLDPRPGDQVANRQALMQIREGDRVPEATLGHEEATELVEAHANDGMSTYTLAPDETRVLTSLLSRLQADFPDPAESAFYNEAWSFIGEVPTGLRRFLAHFRLTEFAPACLITGFPVDDDTLGPTPADIHQARAINAGRGEEYLIALMAATLGEVFNWSTLQMGRLIQDVIPIRGEEAAQSGHGSTEQLAWHTEDAFHPHRADYLLLLGLRNHDRVPTTLASIRTVSLTWDQVLTLCEPRFEIIPDDEHILQLARVDPAHPSLKRIRELCARPPRVPVLFGDPSAPYLCVDPVFMHVVKHDREAASALEVLQAGLDESQIAVVLSPGDVLVIDNYLSVHGRRPFQPRYDGTDRWLKKILVARDLRKSRDHRLASASRVLM